MRPAPLSSHLSAALTVSGYTVSLHQAQQMLYFEGMQPENHCALLSALSHLRREVLVRSEEMFLQEEVGHKGASHLGMYGDT